MRAADEHYRERGRHVRKREAAGPEAAGRQGTGRRRGRRQEADPAEAGGQLGVQRGTRGGGGVPEDV